MFDAKARSFFFGFTINPYKYFLQLVLLLTTAAAIQAQILTPSITSQNSNIYRTLGNLGQVSTHSKTIDTPYSSVSIVIL